MLPDLKRRYLDPAGVRALEAVLALGPWCWPPPGDPAHARATRLVPAGPPDPDLGRTLVVAVCDDTGSLWVLAPVAHGGDSPNGALDFDSRARAAWRNATAALSRSLPLLWSSLAPAAAHHPMAVPLAAQPLRGPEPRVLTGDSFGLGFLLSLASIALGLRVPASMTGSACVAGDGRLSGVGDLDLKIRTVVDLAPRVTRFIVAAEQEEEALRAAYGSRLEIVPAVSGATAVAKVWEGKLAETLVDAGKDPTRRSELIEMFFLLTAGGREGVLDWGPVDDAATLALEHWDGLAPEDQHRLAFAAGVARRHRTNHGELPVPEESWLAELPLPVRVRVVAHLVQQATDVGSVSPGVARQKAGRHLVRGLEACVPHLELLGSLGRLLAVTGDPEGGLRLQQEASEGHLARMNLQGISFSLSEWYRLAGALAHADAFRQAEAFMQRVETQGGIEPRGRLFVDLARARARIGLLENGSDRSAVGDPEPELERLSRSNNVPDHVRFSALRWLARAMALRGDLTGAGAKIDALRHCAGATSQAAPFLALAEMDLALHLGHDPSRYLENLQRFEPGLCDKLLSVAPEPGGARYLARFYNY